MAEEHMPRLPRASLLNPCIFQLVLPFLDPSQVDNLPSILCVCELLLLRGTSLTFVLTWLTDHAAQAKAGIQDEHCWDLFRRVLELSPSAASVAVWDDIGRLGRRRQIAYHYCLKALQNTVGNSAGAVAATPASHLQVLQPWCNLVSQHSQQAHDVQACDEWHALLAGLPLELFVVAMQQPGDDNVEASVSADQLPAWLNSVATGFTHTWDKYGAAFSAHERSNPLRNFHLVFSSHVSMELFPLREEVMVRAVRAVVSGLAHGPAGTTVYGQPVSGEMHKMLCIIVSNQSLAAENQPLTSLPVHNQPLRAWVQHMLMEVVPGAPEGEGLPLWQHMYQRTWSAISGSQPASMLLDALQALLQRVVELRGTVTGGGGGERVAMAVLGAMTKDIPRVERDMSGLYFLLHRHQGRQQVEQVLAACRHLHRTISKRLVTVYPEGSAANDVRDVLIAYGHPAVWKSIEPADFDTMVQSVLQLGPSCGSLEYLLTEWAAQPALYVALLRSSIPAVPDNSPAANRFRDSIRQSWLEAVCHSDSQPNGGWLRCPFEVLEDNGLEMVHKVFNEGLEYTKHTLVERSSETVNDIMESLIRSVADGRDNCQRMLYTVATCDRGFDFLKKFIQNEANWPGHPQRVLKSIVRALATGRKSSRHRLRDEQALAAELSRKLWRHVSSPGEFPTGQDMKAHTDTLLLLAQLQAFDVAADPTWGRMEVQRRLEMEPELLFALVALQQQHTDSCRTLLLRFADSPTARGGACTARALEPLQSIEWQTLLPIEADRVRVFRCWWPMQIEGDRAFLRYFDVVLTNLQPASVQTLLADWSDIVPESAAERWARTMLMILNSTRRMEGLNGSAVLDAMIITACAFYQPSTDDANQPLGQSLAGLETQLQHVSNDDMVVLARACITSQVEIFSAVFGELQRRYQVDPAGCRTCLSAASEALWNWHVCLLNNEGGMGPLRMQEVLREILRVLQPSLRDVLASIQNPATRPTNWRRLFDECREIVGDMAQHTLGGLVHCAAASVLHQVVQIKYEVDTEERNEDAAENDEDSWIAERDEDSWLVGIITLLCATQDIDERRDGHGVDWLLLTVAQCVPIWRTTFRIDGAVADAVFKCVADADSGSLTYQRTLLEALIAHRMSQLPVTLEFDLHASIDDQWLDRQAIARDDYESEGRRLVAQVLNALVVTGFVPPHACQRSISARLAQYCSLPTAAPPEDRLLDMLATMQPDRHGNDYVEDEPEDRISKLRHQLAHTEVGRTFYGLIQGAMNRR